MTVEGVDYSFDRPGGPALVAAGKSFAMRYVPFPGDGGKGLTAVELKDLRANGIAVGLVFESTAGRMFDGHPAGATDAATVKIAASALGFPDDRPVFFACDVDTNPDQLALVDDYLDGAASVLGRGRIGVYGEYDVIDHCRWSGSARWYWQTYAWSGGRVHATAHLYQYQNDQKLNGAAVDFNRALAADFGQWEAELTDPTDAILRALTGRTGQDALNTLATWNKTPLGAYTGYSLIDGYWERKADIEAVTKAVKDLAGGTVSADAIIAGLQEILKRAQQQGVKV